MRDNPKTLNRIGVYTYNTTDEYTSTRLRVVLLDNFFQNENIY